MSPERWVVTGPAGAGKSTWVAQQRKPGDLVWDVDALAMTIAQQPHYPRTTPTISLLAALQESMVRWLELMPAVNCFVIVTNPDDGIRLAARIRAKVLQLPAPGAAQELAGVVTKHTVTHEAPPETTTPARKPTRARRRAVRRGRSK